VTDADMILTDTSMIPFPTQPGDWFMCLCPAQDEVVFVEHALIVRAMFLRGEKVIVKPEPLGGHPGWVRNFDEKYRGYAVGFGGGVASWLRSALPERGDGTAYALESAGFGEPYHVAFFGGRTFAFVPRR
jgi:hypothetical protein